MNRSNLKRLQAVELEMLIEFVNICTRHKLRYYLIGGSCLGAVRHSGFIPWDDDIDIGMPRKDYKIFLEIAKSELPDYLFIQNYITETDFLLNFTKIRNCNTTFIEKNVASMDINHGVYIDIFPLDGVPENKYVRKLNKVIQIILKSGLDGHYINDTQVSPLAKIARFVMKKLFKPINLHKCLDYMIVKYNYDKHDLVMNYFGIWGEREILPRSYFGDGCIYKFENIYVTIPEDYNRFLTSIYGDYMTKPPKEKQVSHHETTVIDLDTPYVIYTKNG